MPVKTLIDGTLLAQCEQNGKVRFGMLRVAEEITKRLLNDGELELAFANSSEAYLLYTPLKKFLQRNSPLHEQKVVGPLLAGSSFPLADRALGKLHRTLSKETSSIKGVDKYDLFHSFCYPFPSKIIRSNIKKSISFLDLIPLRMDGYAELIKTTKQVIENIVPNFAISISEFSKQDLCDYDKRVEPEKVFVVPLAADEKLFHVNKNEADRARIKAKYQLPDNYFLSIASTDGRKNQAQVIKSFSKLILQQAIDDLFLVSTGNSSFNSQILDNLDIDKKVRKKIIFAKPIDEEDLSIIYSNAICFFYMSLYEGFGLPVLEAMQCGTPVVTSNTTSLPEVVGDAAITLSPRDEDALCDAMYRIYWDSAFRQQLSGKGIKRASTFSWDKCAAGYAEIFKKIGEK